MRSELAIQPSFVLRAWRAGPTASLRRFTLTRTARTQLDPVLEERIVASRALAEARGEVLGVAPGDLADRISPSARAVLRDWVTSGDYARTVPELTDRDPDIATQR